MPKSASFFAVLLAGKEWPALFTSVAHEAGRQLVLTVETYSEALRIAKGMRIAVLVTDYTLADGNGCDLLREISASYRLRGVAVVDSHADEALCREAGFIAVLHKPLDRDSLSVAIG